MKAPSYTPPEPIPFEWEALETQRGKTFRVKVIGGWLINTRHVDANSASSTMTFIPDPNHEWRVK